MIWELLNSLVGNFGYIIITSFFMVKIKLLQKFIKNETHSLKEIITLSVMFSILGIMATCLGIPYKGAIVNIRNVSIVTASIVCGPLVGGISGIVCAIHRCLYGCGNITAIPCAIATILGGIIPGIIYKQSEKKDIYTYGTFSIAAIESISIILIKIICRLDESTIASIYIPMITINSVGYCLMMSVIENILNEKDRMEKKQHRTAMELAKHMVIELASLIFTGFQLSKLKEYEKKAAKAEIRALQTQISPHFLFNSLNTIASFVRINPMQARELIVNLSQYLRFNLEVKEEFIELRKEIDHIEAFASIERARFPDKFVIHYEIEESYMDIKIPPLIIEPLVENSIKHGILKYRTGRNVWVRCRSCNENKIIITVEDDGIGINEKIIDDMVKGKSDESRVGLYNVYSRIKLIYGTGLKIERVDKGTRISFKISREGVI